ncbi:MAG: hypothetical protein ACP5SH_20280 [Syntrophobacteraceae bacterium]
MAGEYGLPNIPDHIQVMFIADEVSGPPKGRYFYDLKEKSPFRTAFLSQLHDARFLNVKGKIASLHDFKQSNVYLYGHRFRGENQGFPSPGDLERRHGCNGVKWSSIQA